MPATRQPPANDFLGKQGTTNAVDVDDEQDCRARAQNHKASQFWRSPSQVLILCGVEAGAGAIKIFAGSSS